jgi:hypothetical protein
VEKGRRFWSGLSGQQKVIAGIAAVFVAIAAVMVPVFAFGHGAHQSPSPTGPGGGGGSPSASTAAVDTSSQSYQMGLKEGTDGQAEIAARGGFDIPTHQYKKLSPQDACEGQWQIDSSSELNHRDYMAGCLAGLDQSVPSTVAPPSKKGPNGSTVPNKPGS